MVLKDHHYFSPLFLFTVSAHNVAWHYAPKEKTNSSEAVRASALLTMIHVNSGQVGVGKFMEKLGYKLNDVHDIFKRADEKSITQSNTNRKPSKKITTNTGKEYYNAGQF